MKFNFSTFVASANTILDSIERIAPMASALGIPVFSQAAALAGQLAKVGQAAVDRPHDLEVALTSQNVAELDALIVRLTALVELAEAAAAEAAQRVLAEPDPPK